MRIFKNKKLLLVLLILIICCVGVIWFANYRIDKTTEKQVFSSVDQIPHNKVGLLLGASKSLRSGSPNRYFQNRIKAATALFNAGKIDYIVVSGDNSRESYNEPLDMKNELLKNNIPEERIVLDYAGFRTYDSMVRVLKIFGQQNVTVISQEFHNKRAIYIGRALGMEVVGFNAEDVDSYNGFKTQLREKFARVKVFVDLLVNKEPKFLGEPIEIGK